MQYQPKYKPARIPLNHVALKRMHMPPYAPTKLPCWMTRELKKVQKIVGSILYYPRAVDMTISMALSSIAMEQTKATVKAMTRCVLLLDCLVSNSDAKVRFHASDMVMNIHTDASYLSKTNV